MIEKEIDYKALYDRLVTENEELHMALSALKGATWTKPGITVSEVLEQANKFVRDNYLLIMVVLFVGSSVIGGLYTIWRDHHE